MKLRETRAKGERETHSRTERGKDRQTERERERERERLVPFSGRKDPPNRRFAERYHTTPGPSLEVLMNRKKKFHARAQAAGARLISSLLKVGAAKGAAEGRKK